MRRLSTSAECGNAVPGTGLAVRTGCPIAAPFGVHRTAPEDLWGFPGGVHLYHPQNKVPTFLGKHIFVGYWNHRITEC